MKIITECVGIWLGIATFAFSTTGKYVELKSGVCVPQKKQSMRYKNAPCFSAELGVSWEAWRFGLQMGYVKYENKNIPFGEELRETVFGHPDYKNKKFTALSVMANLYYDWHCCENLSLYVGCGLGVTRLNYRFINEDQNWMVLNKTYTQDKYLLAAQLMCGMSYALNDHWSVSLGYRCMKMEKVKYNWIDDEDLWPSLKTPLLHSLEVGLRYSF